MAGITGVSIGSGWRPTGYTAIGYQHHKALNLAELREICHEHGFDSVTIGTYPDGRIVVVVESPDCREWLPELLTAIEARRPAGVEIWAGT